jgi:hypothetical protein
MPPTFLVPGHDVVLVRCAAQPWVRGVVASMATWGSA